jgi:hypothetical protein
LNRNERRATRVSVPRTSGVGQSLEPSGPLVRERHRVSAAEQREIRREAPSARKTCVRIREGKSRMVELLYHPPVQREASHYYLDRKFIATIEWRDL